MANHNNQNQHCLDIREIAGAIGAEIYGVDLSSPISNDTFKAIHRAFLEYLVIFFPEQKPLESNNLKAFAGRFGEVD